MHEWFEIVGYDLMMMSELAKQAGVTEGLAWSEGYVVRFYFTNPNVMSAGQPVHVKELVRLPGYWEYT
jgi:hypothetical protein